MEYFSQVGVAPSSRTMGTIKRLPTTISIAPMPKAAKKAVDKTWLAFFSLLAEFPSGAWVLATSTYLPRLLSSMREGAQGGAPSDIQVALVAQHRWCKFLVLEFYWYPT